MAELLESLCFICNPKIWQECCNAECISKCFECPGACISGVCNCLGNCCKDINCDWFYTLCSTCCNCSTNPCSNLFEHNCCLNMEHNCLSVFNCTNDISFLSKGIESFCNLFTNQCMRAFTCWFQCMPTSCLLTLGYVTNGQLSYRNTNQMIVISANPREDKSKDENEIKRIDEVEKKRIDDENIEIFEN